MKSSIKGSRRATGCWGGSTIEKHLRFGFSVSKEKGWNLKIGYRLSKSKSGIGGLSVPITINTRAL